MNVLVTGANRGLGLEFARQLAARGDQVFATARNPDEASELRDLAAESDGKIRVFACDVLKDDSVTELVAQLGDAAVDVLINNAGVIGKMQALVELDLADVMRTMDANALGPLRVTRALLPALRRGSTRHVVHISSGMGSISDNNSGGAYAYRMSKAALNMANRSMSVDLAGEGFVCVVMNPGWVQTDMGGGGAPTPVDESIRLMLERIDGLTSEQSGSFLNYKGDVFAY